MLGLRAFFVWVGYVRAAAKELAHTQLDKMTFVGSLSFSSEKENDPRTKQPIQAITPATPRKGNHEHSLN